MADPLANLRPWKKGQSGNPAGRPRKARAAIDVLGVEACENLLRDQLDRAMKGDGSAAKAILDRVWPTLARTELSGVEGKPIELAQAEQVAAELPTDVLRELDALAERVAAANETVETTEPPDAVRH